MIRHEISHRIARIYLDKPTASNALSLADWDALSRAVAAVAASQARVLLLRSANPKCFSAGSDLREMEALAGDVAARVSFRGAMRQALDSIRNLSRPTVAAIDGHCMGAGVALALACDVRIAGEHACFAIPPARFGISYPQEDVNRLVAAIGRGQAARLLFGGERIGAEEAARIGMVEQAAKSAEHEAERFAATIAANAPGSLIALKAVLNADDQRSGEFDLEFDNCFSSSAFVEGIAAFREGRKPEFD